MSLQQLKERRLKSDEAEVVKLAKLQGVKPFDFDEAAGEGAALEKRGI